MASSSRSGAACRACRRDRGLCSPIARLAERMGQAGRQKALESFDEERVFAIVKAAYARLLADKGIARPEWNAPVAHAAQS